MADKKRYVIDNPTLMAEWDWEKNSELEIDPQKLTEGSGKKAWWKCHQGHSTYTVIRSRNNGYGCIICSGRCVVPGVNDLLTVSLELCTEWDYEKNGDLLPSVVAQGSDRKVWWICNKCKSSYNASVAHRVGGSGCPVCAGKKIVKGINDFASKHPELLCEWDYERNLDIMPDTVAEKSHKKVWWKCSVCSAKWNAPISSRSAGYGCPICGKKRSAETRIQKKISQNGSLLSRNFSLAAEWDKEKNAPLFPSDVLPNSHYKAWWICPVCAHNWQAVVKSRNAGVGCPVCARNKAISHAEKEGKVKISPEIVKGKSRQTSFPEQAIYYYILQTYPDALNRYIGIFEGGMELDIYIPSKEIAIEYDGIAWHSTSKTYQREIAKYQICTEHGIWLIRIKENINDNSADSSDILLHTKERLDDTIRQLKKYVDIPDDIDTIRDATKIKERYLTELKSNSIVEKSPDVARQWNFSKNGSLTPDMFSPHSAQKVWWICDSGHEWEAEISSRTSGCGCPYCSGRIAETGTNDFATLYPEIAREWAYERNKGINPTSIRPGSNKNVWWKCLKCGYVWQARVEQRVHGKKCPNCAINKN